MMVKAVPSPPLSRSLLFLVLSLSCFFHSTIIISPSPCPSIPLSLSLTRSTVKLTPIGPVMDLQCRHPAGGSQDRARINRPHQLDRLPSVLILSILILSVVSALPVDQQQPITTPVELLLETSESQVSGISQARRPAEGIEFPNTAFIPGDLTEQLAVDGFFSLWFVFLDDDVFTSGENCLFEIRLIDRVKGKEKNGEKGKVTKKRKSGLWKKGKCQGQSDSQKGKV